MHEKSGCSLIDEDWSVIERSLSTPNLFELGISCNLEENSSVSKELQALATAKSEYVSSPKPSLLANELLEVLWVHECANILSKEITQSASLELYTFLMYTLKLSTNKQTTPDHKLVLKR